ncbi:MAG: hypothetical protein CXR31_00070 [Geobacter sp.]|nr:MAG: hypothetical protein CXR31_00070 [Geobacter sp.]
MNPDATFRKAVPEISPGNSWKTGSFSDPPQRFSPPTAQWHASLDRLIEELERLPALTESRFLKVGAKLQSLSACLREIEDNAATAGNIMSSEETRAAIRELEETASRLERFFLETDRTSARAFSSLGGILEEFGSILRLMENFKGHVSNLRMLKMLTNLESARHRGGGAGFRNVATDIGNLAQNVDGKSTAIISRIKCLRSEMTKAVAMVAGLDSSQKLLGHKVLGTIRQNIAVLAGMHENCAGTAHDISQRSAAIFRDVGNVVVSLQFQDITRQQMEHAREALVGVRTHLANGMENGPDEAITRKVEKTCALQSAQLAHSADELLVAVTRIETSLHDISRQAASSAATVKGLFLQADEVGHASLDDIASRLASIMTAFEENVAITSKLAGVMLTVTDAMAEISAFAEDIDYLGSEIRLIALNAIIKAAQAGKNGSGFSVIAETVKRQSEEICGQTATITDTINTISQHVADMTAGTAGDTGKAEAAQCGEHLTATITRLGEITDALTDLLARTDHAADSLTATIDEALAALDNRETMATLRREVISRLDRLALNERAERRSPISPGTASSLEDATRRYTMVSEREVHLSFEASLTGRRETEAMRGNGLTGRATADHFENNVEFF